jgi:hypothetical protein
VAPTGLPLRDIVTQVGLTCANHLGGGRYAA